MEIEKKSENTEMLDQEYEIRSNNHINQSNIMDAIINIVTVIVRFSVSLQQSQHINIKGIPDTIPSVLSSILGNVLNVNWRIFNANS